MPTNTVVSECYLEHIDGHSKFYHITVERVGAGITEERIPVRFDELVKAGGKSAKNLILRPGDTIFVP